MPKYKINSLEFKSKGIVLLTLLDKPKRIFIQLRKKKVGANKYNNKSKNKANIGNKSKKKLKNNNSAINKIEPGKPKKTKQFNNDIRNNFGHKKFIAESSVIKRVLKRLLMESTRKKELVDKRA